AHMRLMLLGLIYISDAAFARFMNGIVSEPISQFGWSKPVDLYLGSDLLALGLGVYDLMARGRLHFAYVVGIAWTGALQIIALMLLGSPTWKALSLRMIGH